MKEGDILHFSKIETDWLKILYQLSFEIYSKHCILVLEMSIFFIVKFADN